MIIHLDKEDFVISVEHEPIENRSNGTMPIVNRSVPSLSDVNDIETAPCSGAWHRSKKGDTVTFTQLPVTEFSIDKHGSRFRTCDQCRIKSRQSAHINLLTELSHNQLNRTAPVAPVLDTSSLSEPSRQTDGGLMHKWKVTIIKRTTITVYAKDFLGAGVEAGEGEITSVERLD